MINIAQDISVLYELSLMMGTSLELQENCEGFLNALVERKDFDFATLWLKDAEINKYVLTFFTPKTKIKETLLAESHPLVQKLETQAAWSISAQEAHFDEMVTERVSLQGVFTVFALKDIGFVKLYDSKRRDAYSGRELNQLQMLMQKFATTLEASQKHQKLIDEVTERKRIETDLLQSKHVAEQSAKAKERFLANMSHEMRTPLNAIIGMTHLLNGTSLSKQQVGYLEAIQFSSDALLALINDILDFAKIGEGKIEFERVPFKLEELLGGLYAMMRFPAERKKLKLRFEIDPELPRTLIGDPMRLHQVLLNLVGNAIKFTEEGFVWLKVYTVKKDAGEWVLAFEISDTGIGIAEDKLQNIFESFTQASSDTTRRFGGSGLGLAIVKELVEQQNGKITAKSLVSHGSVFTVILHFVEAHDSSEMPTMEMEIEQEVDLHGKHILIVEDNEMNRFVAEQTLRQWGIVVDLAANGRIAVDKVKKNKYDLILMDVQMPEMDGYTASQLIRESMYSMQELPIVALTASMLKNHEQAIFEAGMNDYVLKPFNPSSLRQCIARHIRHNEARVVMEEPLTVEHLVIDKKAAELPPKPLVDLSELVENAFGNTDFVLSVIQLFQQQTPEQTNELVVAWKQQDWDYVKFMAHKMKASARMLGVHRLGDLLQGIEEDIWQSSKLPEGDKRLEEIIRLVDETIETLNRELHALEKV
jgi:signal transduction histidine kinase/CheY-like chemotaxis protein/HPt (histidine-containing phosphotransfer) domain-containing protein